MADENTVVTSNEDEVTATSLDDETEEKTMADARTVAASSIGTYLMYSANGTTYTKLCDIKSVPDLGGKPEDIETTTLSDSAKTYCAGVISQESLEFEANYTAELFNKLDGDTYKGQNNYYAVYFDSEPVASNGTPTGNEGQFTFKGTLNAFVKGFGTNEVKAITITITPSSEIEFSLPTA